MTLGAYLGLLGAWLTAIASPGPDTVQLLRLGARSRRNAVAAALGICCGNIMWPIVTMAGLAALIKAFPWILTGMYAVGGLFLMYMGWSALRTGVRDLRAHARLPRPEVLGETGVGQSVASGQVAATTGIKSLTDFQAWRLGLATNLSNPKALLFFGAVFAQFLPAHVGFLDRVLVIVLMTVVGGIWFCGVAWAVSQPRWARALNRANPWIETVAGVLFILLGGFLVYQAGVRTF